MKKNMNIGDALVGDAEQPCASTDTETVPGAWRSYLCARCLTSDSGLFLGNKREAAMGRNRIIQRTGNARIAS